MSEYKRIKVLYVFAGQRKKMEEQLKKGLMPDTYFIGMNHMSKFNIEAEYIENKLINHLRKINFNLANIFLLPKMRQYDVVFTGASIFFIFLAKVVFRFKRPKFVYYNTSLTNLYRRHQKGFKKWIVKKTINSLDAIICLSSSQRDFLISKGFDKAKLYFIPNGVDVNFISTKSRVIPNSEDYILSVGKDMGRDYKTLIEAVRGSNIKLKIVAAPRNIDSVDKLPSNVSLETLSFMDLLLLYKNCRFVIIPTKQENYLNASDCSGQYVLLDAMASSKAVIASNRRSLTDYFVDGVNGLVVEPENAATLRSAIEWLWARPQEAVAMGKKSFELVSSQCTTEIFAEKLSEVFKSLIDKNAIN